MTNSYQEILGVQHSTPAFAVPPRACDCHVHVFGTHEQYPFDDGRVYMPSPASVEALVELHQALGIERTVIVQASPQGVDNTCLIDSLAKLHSLGREARGVAVVAADVEQAELDALHRAGVRGLRVNLQSFGENDPSIASRQLHATARLAASMNWHVQIYSNLRVIRAVKETILALPVPIVVDHFGLATAVLGTRQEGFEDLLTLVRSGSVYVKLSGAYRITRDMAGAGGEDIVRPLIDANVDRMLWGTDWPHTGAWPGRARSRDRPEALHPIDDGQQLNLLGTWSTPDELEKILATNADRLYAF